MLRRQSLILGVSGELFDFDDPVADPDLLILLHIDMVYDSVGCKQCPRIVYGQQSGSDLRSVCRVHRHRITDAGSVVRERDPNHVIHRGLHPTGHFGPVREPYVQAVPRFDGEVCRNFRNHQSVHRHHRHRPVVQRDLTDIVTDPRIDGLYPSVHLRGQLRHRICVGVCEHLERYVFQTLLDIRHRPQQRHAVHTGQRLSLLDPITVLD